MTDCVCVCVYEQARSLTCSTELQKSSAWMKEWSSGTASAMTGRGLCHSSTIKSRVLGRSEYKALKPVANTWMTTTDAVTTVI